MAYQGLPTYAREGTSLGHLGPAAPIQPQQDGGVPDWMKMVMAGAGGAALNGLANGGGGPLGALISGLKKLFSKKNNSPYGTPGDEGIDFTRWNPDWPDAAQGDPNNPQVTTSEAFSYPNDIFNDPYVLNSIFNGMPNDPSGGTGIGPGMQGYYGATGDHGPDDYWNHP